MKLNLFLPLACLLLLSSITLAQTPDNDEAVAEAFMGQMEKAMMKGMFRSIFDSRINFTMFYSWDESDINETLGITEEQMQQLVDRMENMDMEEIIFNDPDMRELKEQIEAFDDSTDWFRTADEESKQKMLDFYGRIGTAQMDIFSNILDEVLTPEQWQRLNESQLASMAELPFISHRAFEAIDLTEEQKQELEQIRKELEPEFEAFLENVVDMATECDDGTLIMAAMTPGFADMLQNAIEEAKEGTSEEYLEKILKMQEQFDKIQANVKTFSTKLKTQMFDVLTDEQWVRLQELIDNPPEYAKKFRDMLKGQMDEEEAEAD